MATTVGRKPQSKANPQREIPPPTNDLGKRSISQMLAELGTAGTKNFSGILLDEYLPALSFYNAPTVYNQMRRSDGTIASLLAAYKMPLRSAKWFIQPYDDSPEAVRMADFLHDNLWAFGAQTFDDFQREAWTMLDFGFSWFEKIFDWMPENSEWSGMLGWDQFAFRYQSTRWRYNTEIIKGPRGTSHRRLVSITQFAPPDYAMVDIPKEKILIFSRDKEGMNYDGVSLLRPCYKHWYIVDMLYRIQGIGLERESVGVPRAKWLQQTDDATIDYVRQMIENMRVDDQASVMYDANIVEIDYLSGHFNAQAIALAIDHHKSEIMKSGLAQFVNLGTRSFGTTGSYALSQDQSEMFLDALNGEANYFSSEFFLQAIIQLMEYNFPNVDRRIMPRLSHGDIGQRAVNKMSAALNSFAQYGFLVPDPRTENVIREFMDLPERDLDYHLEQLAKSLEQGHTPAIEPVINPKNTPATPAPPPAPGTPTNPGKRAVKAGPQTRTKSIGGSSYGTKMNEHEALRTQEDFYAEIEATRRNALKYIPERPSVRIARIKQPYTIRGDT